MASVNTVTTQDLKKTLYTQYKEIKHKGNAFTNLTQK